MKVVLINGSRREQGCTYTSLMEISKVLKSEGIDTELFFLGVKVIDGHISELLDKVEEAMKDADGIIIGSPVYFASPTGELISFLDRLFMKANASLKFKPAAAITTARRAGTTATLDVIHKYFLYNQMPIVSSRYWSMAFGNSPEEVVRDEEGMQIMQTVGKNMAWIVKSIAAGKAAGVKQPVAEPRISTNFIR
jgi:FMN reductase, NADPH-dependent domain protein